MPSEGTQTSEYVHNALFEAKDRLHGLIWDKIETTPPYSNRYIISRKNYGSDDQFKIAVQRSGTRFALIKALLAFSAFSDHIGAEKGKEFYRFGVCRRLFSILHQFEKIISIIPEDRSLPLSRSESRDVSDAICLIFIHIPAIIDLVSHICYQCLLPSQNLSFQKIDLLRKDFQKRIKSRKVLDLIDADLHWIVEIKENYRHSIAHRVPPYVPNVAFSPEEAKHYNALEEKKWRLLFDGDIQGVESIEDEQSRIGRFYPWFHVDDLNGHVLIFPTISDSVIRINYFVAKFIAIMIEDPHFMPR